MQARVAASLAKSLAIAASVVWRLPWSASQAARYVRSAAASSSVFESASIHWMAWNSAMGLPNCLRSLA